MQELEARAKKANRHPAIRIVQTTAYVRDAAVAEYVRRHASGVCDLCQTPAPFRNRKKEPYLECHHVVWLAQGGEDTITNTVALCPNCHRKMHVVNDEVDKEKLKQQAANRN